MQTEKLAYSQSARDTYDDFANSEYDPGTVNYLKKSRELCQYKTTKKKEELTPAYDGGFSDNYMREI